MLTMILNQTFTINLGSNSLTEYENEMNLLYNPFKTNPLCISNQTLHSFFAFKLKLKTVYARIHEDIFQVYLFCSDLHDFSFSLTGVPVFQAAPTYQNLT